MKRFSSAALHSAAPEKEDGFGSRSAVLPALGFGSPGEEQLDVGAEGSIPTPCRILAVAVGQMITSQVLNSPNP